MFDRIDAVLFDVIGTLVDERETWTRASERVVAQTGLSSAAVFRRRWVKILDARMSAIATGQAPWVAHSQLIAESARDAVSSLGGTESDLHTALIASLDRDYPAWPDVPEATAALRRHRLVAGLSNGDVDSLARLANTNGISWDIVLSTGAVRTYKPAPAAYDYAIRALQIDPTRALFVASHPWDLRAAAQHGFLTAYIARPGAEQPTEDDHFDMSLDGLEALTRRMASGASGGG